MNGPKRLFLDCQRPLGERFGVGKAALLFIEQSEILQKRPQDRHRSPVERRGVRVAVLLGIEQSQIIQRLRDKGMIGPKRLLLDPDRPLKQWLGFGIALLSLIQNSEIV